MIAQRYGPLISWWRWRVGVRLRRCGVCGIRLTPSDAARVTGEGLHHPVWCCREHRYDGTRLP